MTNIITSIPELDLQKQVSEDHDTECALKAGELIELGFMGEEFSNYGIGYLEDGKAKYFICNHEKTMERFQRRCFSEGLCMTRVVYNVERYQVPVGRNDFFSERVRKNLADILKMRYGKSFFQALQACQQTLDVTDDAWGTIASLLEVLRNSLDEHLIQIVRGLAEDAYEMKKLSREHYWRVMQWVQRENRNTEGSGYDDTQYRRIYYGFCSQRDGTLYYYSNASLFTVEQKKREKIVGGEIVSPILKKAYTADAQEQLMMHRNNFVELLKKYLCADFMRNLRKIWLLPPAVDVEIYQQGLHALEKERKQECLEDYLYYGHIWNTV